MSSIIYSVQFSSNQVSHVEAALQVYLVVAEQPFCSVKAFEKR